MYICIIHCVCYNIISYDLRIVYVLFMVSVHTDACTDGAHAYTYTYIHSYVYIYMYNMFALSEYIHTYICIYV